MPEVQKAKVGEMVLYKCLSSTTPSWYSDTGLFLYFGKLLYIGATERLHGYFLCNGVDDEDFEFYAKADLKIACKQIYNMCVLSSFFN